MPENTSIEAAAPESELNEAADLRAEEARVRYDARMEVLDRRDRAGPHDPWRS